jgi:hypothetical protein
MNFETWIVDWHEKMIVLPILALIRSKQCRKNKNLFYDSDRTSYKIQHSVAKNKNTPS